MCLELDIGVTIAITHVECAISLGVLYTCLSFPQSLMGCGYTEYALQGSISHARKNTQFAPGVRYLAVLPGAYFAVSMIL